MRDKFLKVLKDNAYTLEKHGAKFIADYQFERVARELEDALRKKECAASVTVAMFERMHKELNLTLEDIANIHAEWEQNYFNKARGLNTDWAGLDPVKFKDVGKRKYIIFGDSEDTNITP